MQDPTPNTGLISPSMKPGTEDKGSEDNLGTTVLCHPKGHCDKREVGRGLSHHISQVRKQVQRGKLICLRPHSKRTCPGKEVHPEPGTGLITASSVPILSREHTLQSSF